MWTKWVFIGFEIVKGITIFLSLPPSLLTQSGRSPPVSANNNSFNKILNNFPRLNSPHHLSNRLNLNQDPNRNDP